VNSSEAPKVKPFFKTAEAQAGDWGACFFEIGLCSRRRAGCGVGNRVGVNGFFTSAGRLGGQF
jgi:hypothetical protein